MGKLSVSRVYVADHDPIQVDLLNVCFTEKTILF